MGDPCVVGALLRDACQHVGFCLQAWLKFLGGSFRSLAITFSMLGIQRLGVMSLQSTTPPSFLRHRVPEGNTRLSPPQAHPAMPSMPCPCSPGVGGRHDHHIHPSCIGVHLVILSFLFFSFSVEMLLVCENRKACIHPCLKET